MKLPIALYANRTLGYFVELSFERKYFKENNATEKYRIQTFTFLGAVAEDLDFEVDLNNFHLFCLGLRKPNATRCFTALQLIIRAISITLNLRG